ncbi:hypothetical protein [Methylophilus sp. Leaf408]|nr:hypothetical protein [Methylophilus sp. Leaf408]
MNERVEEGWVCKLKGRLGGDLQIFVIGRFACYLSDLKRDFQFVILA